MCIGYLEISEEKRSEWKVNQARSMDKRNRPQCCFISAERFRGHRHIFSARRKALLRCQLANYSILSGSCRTKALVSVFPNTDNVLLEMKALSANKKLVEGLAFFILLKITHSEEISKTPEGPTNITYFHEIIQE